MITRELQAFFHLIRDTLLDFGNESQEKPVYLKRIAVASFILGRIHFILLFSQYHFEILKKYSYSLQTWHEVNVFGLGNRRGSCLRYLSKQFTNLIIFHPNETVWWSTLKSRLAFQLPSLILSVCRSMFYHLRYIVMCII